MKVKEKQLTKYVTRLAIEEDLKNGDRIIVRHGWHFSICDWAGNELFCSDSESEMLSKWQEICDQDDWDIQVFAYPTIDGELIEKVGWYVRAYEPYVYEKELYEFPATF